MSGERHHELGAGALHQALAHTPALRWRSLQRDALWLVVQSTVCTRGHARGTAMGSAAEQEVGGPDARQDELVSAMTWLTRHEQDARLLSPDELFRKLRGVAVRGRDGSARGAQKDALHGMTGVAAGSGLRFSSESVP